MAFALSRVFKPQRYRRSKHVLNLKDGFWIDYRSCSHCIPIAMVMFYSSVLFSPLLCKHLLTLFLKSAAMLLTTVHV